jgi:hypothetical protein
MFLTRCSPKILEAEIELVAHLVVYDPADADSARLGQGFEAGGDVDAVAVMSPSSMIISPRLMPMRNSIRRSAAMSALRSAIARCTSTAQRTASTTLANSTKAPSPVVLTRRPQCSLTFGSINSRCNVFSAASVPSSSSPISRE